MQAMTSFTLNSALNNPESAPQSAPHYGYDEGEAAGAAQKQREIAKNMKEKNIPNADIAEITGLSAEEIEKL